MNDLINHPELACSFSFVVQLGSTANRNRALKLFAAIKTGDVDKLPYDLSEDIAEAMPVEVVQHGGSGIWLHTMKSPQSAIDGVIAYLQYLLGKVLLPDLRVSFTAAMFSVVHPVVNEFYGEAITFTTKKVTRMSTMDWLEQKGFAPTRDVWPTIGFIVRSRKRTYSSHRSMEAAIRSAEQLTRKGRAVWVDRLTSKHFTLRQFNAKSSLAGYRLINL